MNFKEYKGLLDKIMGMPDFVLPEMVNPSDFRAAAGASWINGKRDRSGKIAFEKCTAQSLVAAIRQIAAWGLLPDGRWAALVPYGSDCQALMMYQGAVELMRRIGCERISGSDIREGERLVMTMDQDQMKHMRHVGPDGDDIDMMQRSETVIGAYVRFDFRGDTYFEHVDARDLSAARKDTPAHRQWAGEMARKMVINRARKMLPLHAWNTAQVSGDAFELLPDADNWAHDELPQRDPDVIEGKAKPVREEPAQIENAPDIEMAEIEDEARDFAQAADEVEKSDGMSKAAAAFLDDEDQQEEKSK